MSYYILYPLFWLLGKLPYRAQQWLSSLIYFVIYKVVKYRVSVVKDNLSQAFKDKSDEELLDIEHKFYRHLADVFVDTIVMASISRKTMHERMEFINADQIEHYTKGKAWISAMAHYGTWELTTSWGDYSEHNKVYAVYRPLHNKGVDRYYRKTRSLFGVHPLAMESVGREIIRNRRDNQQVTIAMIADQTPPPISIQNWSPFFGRMTPFFVGMEKLALKFNMPVAFLHIDKFDKQRYKAWFEIIYDGTESVEEGEITRRYIDKLETMIRQRPELWMWSHRRWKHRYNPENHSS